MNLFGMPPLLGGGKDGLKIGSVGLLLIVTEVQVVILYVFMSNLFYLGSILCYESSTPTSQDLNSSFFQSCEFVSLAGISDN